MRGVEFVIGVVVLASGIAGPITLPVDDVFERNQALVGDLWFHEVAFEGIANISASDAAAVVSGPMATLIHAEAATVSVHWFTNAGLVIEEPVRFGEFRTGPKGSDQEHYDEVQITVEGLSGGSFQVWPHGAGADLDLRMIGDGGSTIHASTTTTFLKSVDGDYVHLIEAPLFGMAHLGDAIEFNDIPSMRLGSSIFERLNISGDFLLIVEDANLSIDHADGRDKISIQNSNLMDEPFPFVMADEMAYAVIMVSNGRLTMGFDGVQAVVLARDSEWEFNGTLGIEVNEGRLAAREENTDLRDHHVDVRGKSTLRLSATGDPSGKVAIGPVTVGGVGAMKSEPRSHAHLHTADGEVLVDGRPLMMAIPSASQTLEEGVTILAKIVGSLLIAWAAARWCLVSIAGLVVKRPLENPRRRAILEVLEREGMLHVRDLHRATGIPLGTLVYHLGILDQARLVQCVEKSGYKVYFIAQEGISRDEATRIAILASPTRRSIWNALEQEGALTQKQLASRLRLSQSQVAKQLKVLVKSGLVVRHGTRNAKYVVASAAAGPYIIGSTGLESENDRVVLS